MDHNCEDTFHNVIHKPRQRTKLTLIDTQESESDDDETKMIHRYIFNDETKCNEISNNSKELNKIDSNSSEKLKA